MFEEQIVHMQSIGPGWWSSQLYAKDPFSPKQLHVEIQNEKKVAEKLSRRSNGLLPSLDVLGEVGGTLGSRGRILKAINAEPLGAHESVTLGPAIPALVRRNQWLQLSFAT